MKPDAFNEQTKTINLKPKSGIILQRYKFFHNKR